MLINSLFASLQQQQRNTDKSETFAADYDARTANIGEILRQLSGTPTPELASKAQSSFAEALKSISDQFGAKQVSEYKPNILSSPSYTAATQAVKDQVGAYSTNLMSGLNTISNQITGIGTDTQGKVKASGKEITGGLQSQAQNYGAQAKQTAKEGTNLLGDISQRGAERFYNTLSVPFQAFQSASGNRAFSNMYNPDFMRLASAPPSVRSDVESMRGLYTYNV